MCMFAKERCLVWGVAQLQAIILCLCRLANERKMCSSIDFHYKVCSTDVHSDHDWLSCVLKIFNREKILQFIVGCGTIRWLGNLMHFFHSIMTVGLRTSLLLGFHTAHSRYVSYHQRWKLLAFIAQQLSISIDFYASLTAQLTGPCLRTHYMSMPY